MKKSLTTLALAFTLMFTNAFATAQDTAGQADKFEKRHYDGAECIAFYKYGHALTKRDNRSYEIANKFEALNKYLRKWLKLDVGELDIKEIRKIGRESFKKHMEENDHKYELKVDDYDSELLDLYKRYNAQCQGVIQFYKTFEATL